MQNPFFIDPNMGRDPNAIQGLGQAIQGYQARNAKADAQAQQDALRQEALSVFQERDPNKVAAFTLANPQYSQAMKNSMGIVNAQQESEAKDFTRSVLSNPEGAKQAFETRIQSLQSQGRDAKDTIQSYKDWLANPEAEIKDLELVFAGLADEQEWKAYQGAGEKFKQATGKGMQGWSFDESTGAYSLDPNYQEFLQSDAANLAKKEFLGAKDISGINDKITGLVKESGQIRSAALDLEALSNDASQPAVIAAIFKFMKALDPTSAVRENEVGMIEGAEGAAQGIANMYNRLMGEGGMSTEGFAEIVRTSKTLSNSAAVAASDSVNSYTDVIADNMTPKQLKLMRKRVPVQFEIAERAVTPPPQNTQGWGLQKDASGNMAYVGPNGEIEEVQ